MTKFTVNSLNQIILIVFYKKIMVSDEEMKFRCRCFDFSLSYCPRSVYNANVGIFSSSRRRELAETYRSGTLRLTSALTLLLFSQY